MSDGKLIVIEGLDGSGKSTQSKLLLDNLNSLNKPSFLSIKPSQYLIGGIVRSRLSGDWQCSSECLQTLFFADHLFSIEKEIEPRLKKGINVISDRYIHSTYAYGALDCDKDWLMNMNKIIRKPDLIIFLKVSVDICLKRIDESRFSKELYESKEILMKINDNYMQSLQDIKTKDNKEIETVIIDGENTVINISKEIKEKVINFLYKDYEYDCVGI